MAGYYQLTESAPNQFQFTLHAENGQVILTSEPYPSKKAAKRAIGICQASSPFESHYLFLIGADGHPYFALTADDGKVLAASELYPSIPARENGLRAVKSSGASFVVKDMATA